MAAPAVPAARAWDKQLPTSDNFRFPWGAFQRTCSTRSGDQVIRENPSSRGTETSAEVLVWNEMGSHTRLKPQIHRQSSENTNRWMPRLRQH